jgi:hypothetical protein
LPEFLVRNSKEERIMIATIESIRQNSAQAALAVRVNRANPNHHLWLNNGTWFVHFTVYPDNLTKERVRSTSRSTRTT